MFGIFGQRYYCMISRSTGKCLSCLIFLCDIPKSLHPLLPTFTQSTTPWQSMYCSVVYTVSHTNCLQTGMFKTHSYTLKCAMSYTAIRVFFSMNVVYCISHIPQQSTLSVTFKLQGRTCPDPFPCAHHIE